MAEQYKSDYFSTKQGQERFEYLLSQPIRTRIGMANIQLEYWHGLDTTDQYFAADIARLKEHIAVWEQQWEQRQQRARKLQQR